LVTVGCGGGDDTEPAPTTESATTNEDGTTVAGTELDLGKTAVVDFKVDQNHDSQIELTVTKVKKGKVKDLHQFDLNDAARNSSVYYVSTNVKNLGPDALSNQKLVLYGKVSNDLVVPPVVLRSSFAKCDYTPLPKKFTEGKSAKGCMVMLAQNHGTISEVQWRAPDDSEPISWIVAK
jgi:hypothetical protein